MTHDGTTRLLLPLPLRLRPEARLELMVKVGCRRLRVHARTVETLACELRIHQVAQRGELSDCFVVKEHQLVVGRQVFQNELVERQLQRKADD